MLQKISDYSKLFAANRINNYLKGVILIGTRILDFARRERPMAYKTAKTWCKSIGGKLPTPANADENKFLYELGNTWMPFKSTGRWAFYRNWHSSYVSRKHRLGFAQLISVDPVRRRFFAVAVLCAINT